MFKQRDIITAIEIGTSKICVLIGECVDDKLYVIGKGEVPSDGAVVKGEIVSMDLTMEKLIDAMDLADAESGNELNNSSIYAMTVTGCDITSIMSEGTAFVQNEEHRISNDDIQEAINNAKHLSLPSDRSIISCFDGYYMVDGMRRATHPVNQRANVLKAYSHVVHGNSNRLENFSAILHDAGVEYTPVTIFSPIADMHGLLSDDEQKNGTLLIDFGAGSTEYAVICNKGILASGLIGIGFEHVANDLSIGLNLPINDCRKMLEDGTLEKYTRENQQFIECRLNSGGTRRIPVESFNRIADARIRDIFELIRNTLCKESFWSNLAAGGVLTGGGAKFFKTREIFHQVCDLPSRLGKPFSPDYAIPPELDDPCYSTVYGTLCYGYKTFLQYRSRQQDGLGEKLISFLGDALAQTIKTLRNK